MCNLYMHSPWIYKILSANQNVLHNHTEHYAYSDTSGSHDMKSRRSHLVHRVEQEWIHKDQPL